MIESPLDERLTTSKRIFGRGPDFTAEIRYSGDNIRRYGEENCGRLVYIWYKVLLGIGSRTIVMLADYPSEFFSTLRKSYKLGSSHLERLEDLGSYWYHYGPYTDLNSSFINIKLFNRELLDPEECI